MASRASPSVVIEQSGDVFSIKTVTPVRTQEDAFTVGQPYEMDSMGGLTMQVLYATTERHFITKHMEHM